MAKVSNKTKGFNSISRDVVFDNELSDRARFLYVYMACKPEGWEFYQDKVAEEIGYKKDTLRKYLDELITRGWITEEEQRNGGKFGCLAYIIEIKRRSGNLPVRENTVSEKNRNGKNHNQKDIYNISSIQSISDNRDIEEENKRLSNDNQKIEYSEEFEKFWKLYGYPKDKKTAYSRWNHLSQKDKELAVKALPSYFEDCARCKRSKQHPSTYLNKRTWEDDFTQKQKVAFYDPFDTDSDEKKRFKEWMRNNHPEIENTALPLSYEDYMELVGKNYERVYLINAILDDIDREIWKYRKSDIATVIRQEVRKEEADD